MNKVVLMGRLTKEPETRKGGDTNVAKYTLAVDRRVRRDNNDPNAQTADFAENWLHKGTKIAITGHIQTGKYTNKDGQTVYTTDVVVEDQEFAESKSAESKPKESAPAEGGFVAPDDMEDLPFK